MDDKNLCGLSKIWATSPADPFINACLFHDWAFEQRHHAINAQDYDNPVLNMSLHDVNANFFKLMDSVATARRSRLLHIRKWIYYGVVKTVSWIVWPGK